MTIPLQELVDAAVIEGRVKRIPLGETGRPVRASAGGKPLRTRPETCGYGFQVPRHGFLDEMDGDFS